jgi:hypothetical protein
MRLSWLAEWGHIYFAPIAAKPPPPNPPLVTLSNRRHLCTETRAILAHFSTKYALQSRKIK